MSRADEEFYEAVMMKIDAFNFGDNEESAETVFKAWAAQHAHQFEDDCDAKEQENKLE